GWDGALPGRPPDRPGADGQPGAGTVEVAVEHDGQRALAVMAPLGGGQGGALPCGAGLPGGGPGGDDFDQAICFMVPGRLSHAVGQGFSSPPSAVNGCPAGSTGEAFSSRLQRFSSTVTLESAAVRSASRAGMRSAAMPTQWTPGPDHGAGAKVRA